MIVRANEIDVDQFFEGVMIPVNDPFIGYHNVPGWKCKRCCWLVGTSGLPPTHKCPDDGDKQTAARVPGEEL